MEREEGADGGRVVRVSRCSCDLDSRTYSGTLTRRDLACWYDVHPFSLTLWPHHFCENVRRGAWWIKKFNYAYIAVELLLDGEVIYEQAGKKFHLSRPGEIFLTCPGSDIRFRSGKNRYARQLQLIISGGTIKLLLESLGMNFCGVILPETPAAFEERHVIFVPALPVVGREVDIAPAAQVIAMPAFAYQALLRQGQRAVAFGTLQHRQKGREAFSQNCRFHRALPLVIKMIIAFDGRPLAPCHARRKDGGNTKCG